MIKYDDNSGRITFKLQFSFSPRSWWGHTKYWFKYLTSSKERELYRKRREVLHEACEKIYKEAEFAVLFGMEREKFIQRYKDWSKKQ
jgi:hypothetical protein